MQYKESVFGRFGLVIRNRVFSNKIVRKIKRGFSWAGFFKGSLFAAISSMMILPVMAEESFPEKPIRFVIPYAVGGVSDSIGRLIAQGLSKELGQTVVVENRGGGGGTIGAAVVASAKPDGYTILLTSPPMVAVAPVLLDNLSYDSAEDFTPIGILATTPNILAVNKDLPIRELNDLKTYDGGEQLSFASAGPGSTGHLSGHILQESLNIEM